jgi:DUF3100 family protein
MKLKNLFYDFKIHIVAFILVVIADSIGIRPVALGPIKFSLLPMLYALVLGIALSQFKSLNILSHKDMVVASPYIGISVMYLSAYMGSTIGPNLHVVLTAGPALILQELGNLGTIFLSMPLAILVFKMDRTAIGSAFSTSREGSLAIVGDLYGLDSPEGRGVMGSYITGTLLGTIFNGILASLCLNIPWFSPESLAMASGTGSASMMSAAIAPIVEAFPENAEALTALSASSQVLTGIDGMYMSLFVAIPLTNWLYKKIKGKKAVEEEERMLAAQTEVESIETGVDDINDVSDILVEGSEAEQEHKWVTRIKILVYSGLFASIANWLSTLRKDVTVSPLEAIPGIMWLFILIVIGNAIKDFLDSKNIKLPTIIYISLIATITSIPNFLPTQVMTTAALSKISLLPLCTPILAYAGIATGKDMAEFKKQGLKIILITLFALAGTYLGSAIISNIVLKLTT